MEAPVPASSLIHSATLVSAGIFLILKFQTIFYITNLYNTLFILGSFTAAYGGIIAASQSDVKKLLAYSTISHCGFIVSSIALNNLIVTVTYLYLHGLYKALTFFCAGSLIKYNNTQDMRLMGSLKLQLINTITILLASLNLGGLPFLFGYLYKQLFLSSLINVNFTTIGYGFCIIGMLSSPVYVFKLNYYSSFDFRKGFIQSIFIILQNNKKIQNSYVFFTYVKFIAFLIIYIYACCFFFILKFYILKNYTNIALTPQTTTNIFQLVFLNLEFKNHLIKIYYLLFTLAVIIIILQKNRTNYFYLQSNQIILTSVVLILFINIISTILQYVILLLNYDKLHVYFINFI
jgi:NADH:ubiquinone oxidoreductase subunit 5 (subunit L)/multisubunit Na+/H+ antiporter MnhA subunit